jgi:hypothetical protein
VGPGRGGARPGKERVGVDLAEVVGVELAGLMLVRSSTSSRVWAWVRQTPGWTCVVMWISRQHRSEATDTVTDLVLNGSTEHDRSVRIRTGQDSERGGGGLSAGKASVTEYSKTTLDTVDKKAEE